MTKGKISRRDTLKGSVAVAVAAATSTYPISATAQNKDRLIIGMTQEPVQFNPLLYANTGTENVPEACMFDALWDVNEKGELAPNLAAEIPTQANGGISADGTVIKVKMKRDVKWSDGQPLTAKDVEFTYQTVINPSVPVRSRSGFDLIKNFKVVDDQNLEMELSKPYVPFMWAWQNMHIVPQHLLKDEKDLKTSAWNANPIGSGPFLLKARTAGSHMVYERNPNYHRGPAKVRQFIHKFVPDQLVLFGQGKTGEVDFLATQGVPNDRWKEAKEIKDRVFFANPMPFVQFIYFNCGKPQFTDPKVRKALYIALEMKKSLDDVYYGTWERTFSYLHPSHWAYNANLKEETRQSGARSQNARRVGLAGRRRRRPREGRRQDEVHLLDDRRQPDAAELPAAVPAELEEDRRRDGNQEHAGLGGVGRVHHQVAVRHAAGRLGADGRHGPRLHRALPFEVHSGQGRQSGSNYVQYENAEVDKLLDLGVTQTNVEERKATYTKIQEILLRDVPFAPQGAVQQGFLRHAGLTGIKMNQYVVDNTWNVQDWGWA